MASLDNSARPEIVAAHRDVPFVEDQVDYGEHPLEA
jgi:hypothetical protein